jgi:signal transduction histidine kinase
MAPHRERPAGPPPGPRATTADDARLRAEAVAAAERRIAERFARLHATTAALSAALTPAQVAAAIAWRGAGLPAAVGCAVAVARDPGGALEIAAARGEVERLSGDGPELPADAPGPLAAAVRERRPLFVAGDEARAQDIVASSYGFPREPLRALAALPLEAGERVLGAVGVAFAEPLAFDEEERAFLQAFAHACAQALERARLYAAEREARLEAQRAEEAARRAVELEERLAGIVGHDLRTPLAAITMSVAVLLRRGGLAEDQRRTLGRIGASAGRMGRIIRDLLDFTRLRNEGAIPIHAQPTDLAQLAERAAAELAAAHPSRDVLLDAERAAPLDGDADRLTQVITNLAANALQHGPPDAPVTISVGTEGDDRVLRVHNEGPPIPDDVLAHVFEPFRRGVAGGEGGSLGLGLFIVREVVRAHGGTVEVTSAPGEGTTFTIRLPSRPWEGAEASSGRPAPER